MIKIRIADFMDPTLLIMIDSNGIELLASLLENRKNFNFNELDTVDICTSLSVETIFAKKNRLVYFEGALSNPSRVVLSLTDENTREAVLSIRGMISEKKPCHAYIDIVDADSGFVVMISKGEYDDTSW